MTAVPLTKITSTTVTHLASQGDALKKQLLNVLTTEQRRLSALWTAMCDLEQNQIRVNNQSHQDTGYYQIKQKQLHLNYCQEMLASIEHIETAGDWQESLYLRNLVKPYVKLKASLIEVINTLTAQLNQSTSPEQYELAEGQRWIYISLFQNQGHSLAQWTLQLKSIDRYLQGRPIYAEEAEVISFVRSHRSTINHAYVVAWINEDQLDQDPYAVPRYDRCGHTLLTLKGGAVKPAHIVTFVHMNQFYHFQDGQLIPMERSC